MALRGMVNKIRNQEEMWKQQQPSVRNNNKEKAEQIKQQLNDLIKKQQQIDDGHTTAPSLPFNPEGEKSIKTNAENQVPNIYMAPAESLEDLSMVTTTSQSTIKSSPYSARKPDKSSSQSSTPRKSSTDTQKPSDVTKQPVEPVRSPTRIPRFNSKSKLVVRNAPPEKATDSGFVGSESSRQSSKKRDSIQPEPVSAVSKASAASDRSSKKRRTKKLTPQPKENKPKQPVETSFDDEVSTTSTVADLVDSRGSLKSLPTNQQLSSTTGSEASTVRRRPKSLKISENEPSDAALQTLKSEIARLKEEEEKEKVRLAHEAEIDKLKKEAAELRRMQEEYKKAQSEKKQDDAPSVKSSASKKSVRSSIASSSESETLKNIKSDIQALKQEVKKRSQPVKAVHPRRKTASSDNLSDSTLTISQIKKPRTLRTRSPAKLSRKRSRSLVNIQPPQPLLNYGYWTYVPDAPIWTTAPLGRSYLPLGGQKSPSKISPVSNLVRPQENNSSVIISPKPYNGGRLKKADVYILDNSNASNYSPQNVDASIDSITFDTSQIKINDKLNSSLDRAIRSALKLRNRSQLMYQSIEDDVNTSRLFADSF